MFHIILYWKLRQSILVWSHFVQICPEANYMNFTNGNGQHKVSELEQFTCINIASFQWQQHEYGVADDLDEKEIIIGYCILTCLQMLAITWLHKTNKYRCSFCCIYIKYVHVHRQIESHTASFNPFLNLIPDPFPNKELIITMEGSLAFSHTHMQTRKMPSPLTHILNLL